MLRNIDAWGIADDNVAKVLHVGTGSMIRAAAPSTYVLDRFDPRLAASVASWVRSADELFMLAPSTPPPLTASKVRVWTQQHGEPLMFRESATGALVGYAELNPMRRDRSHLWIGHVIVDPARRGQGLGFALTRALLDRAFDMQRAERVTLVVFPENQAAVECYRAAGFRIHGEETQRLLGPVRHCRLLRMEMSADTYARAIRAPRSATLARL